MPGPPALRPAGILPPVGPGQAPWEPELRGSGGEATAPARWPVAFQGTPTVRDRFFLGCCWAGGWACGATMATGGAWAAGVVAGGVVGVRGEAGAAGAGVGVAGLRPLLYMGARCLN